MKINKNLPGNLITGEKMDEISKKILLRINPEPKDPFENINSWTPITKDRLYNNLDKELYILYIHPVHTYMNKLFEVQVEDVINFIDRYFNLERGDGVDIILSNKDFTNIIVGNHDGFLFKAH